MEMFPVYFTTIGHLYRRSHSIQQPLIDYSERDVGVSERPIDKRKVSSGRLKGLCQESELEWALPLCALGPVSAD